MKKNPIVIVEITEKGSLKAMPAIWYGGKAGERFKVQRCKNWPSFFEVVECENKGMIIDPTDCKDPNINS